MSAPASYAYQWRRGGAPIPGATTQTYVTTSADGGASLDCLVTASNSGGATSHASNALAISASAPASVWSASDASASAMTLTNGGLTVTPSGVAAWQSLRSSISKSSGKLYAEFAVDGSLTVITEFFGLASASFNPGSYLGSSTYSGGTYPDGGNQVSAGFTSNLIPSFSTLANCVIGIAVDFSAGSMWLALNNTWAEGGNPATGSLPIISFVPAIVGPLFLGMTFNGAGNGVWTLQPTAASQKYAPPSGFSAWDSAAPTHSPQALAYLARTVGGDEGGNGANIASLIDGLVSDGVWAKLDCLYVLAQQNATDALLNLVGTSYTLTNAGSVPFTTYRGYSGFNLSNTPLNTAFNAATAPSPNFTQNSASFGVWTNGGVASEPYAEMGNSASGANGESQIYNDYTGAVSYARVNNPSVGSVASLGTVGLFVGDRPSSTTVIPYFNGTAQTSQASTSQAVFSGNFLIGFVAGTGSSEQICAAFIGGSPGAAGQLALYNRLRTYMTAVGVP